MNTRALFKLAYRIMRHRNMDVRAVNLFWMSNRCIYRAASYCHVQEASNFSGWVNRDRRNAFLVKRTNWRLAHAHPAN